MRDRIARDRLIVKLFYTACFVWTGLLLMPIVMITDEPDRWGPTIAGTLFAWLPTCVALLPVWVPQTRRQYSGLPRDPLEVVRVIWAFLAPFAATMIVWATFFAPVSLLYSDDHPGPGLALSAAVTLVGTGLIILLTWDVAAERDLIPPRQPGRAEPPPDDLVSTT